MKRDIQLATPAVRELLTLVPVANGGTAARTVSEAAANLGGISQNAMGVAGGVVKLDATGKIPKANLPDAAVTGPTLSGPSSIGTSSRASWKITNYDPDTTYAVSCLRGYISIDGDTVYYESPTTTGTEVMTIAGKNFTLPTVDPLPATPTVSATTTGNSTSASIVGSTTAFSELAAGVSVGTHKSTDWQASTTPDFSSIAAYSFDDTINLLTWTSTAVPLGTIYYVRARHRDTNNRVSEWSAVVQIATDADYIPNTEEAKLVEYDASASNAFGQSLGLSADGTRLIAGNWKKNEGTGKEQTGSAYAFHREGKTWVFDQKFISPGATSTGGFGASSFMSADGNRLIIGAHNEVGSAGQAYVYSRSGNVWTLEGTLVNPSPVSQDFFGSAVALNGDGTRAICGCNGADNGSTTDTGCVYVFKRTGTTWAQEAKLYASDPTSGSSFGNTGACMSYDGTRFIIGAIYMTVSGLSQAGAAYIFYYNGTAWAQEAKLVSDAPTASHRFGWNVMLTQAADRAFVATPYANSGQILQAGRVSIYLRTGTTWALETTIAPPSPQTAGLFGLPVFPNIDGTKLLVCAQGESQAGIAGGAVYFYQKVSGVWTLINKLKSSDYAAGDAFGSNGCLSADGTVAAVAAGGADPSSISNAGAVYIYS